MAKIGEYGFVRRAFLYELERIESVILTVVYTNKKSDHWRREKKRTNTRLKR